MQIVERHVDVTRAFHGASRASKAHFSSVYFSLGLRLSSWPMYPRSVFSSGRFFRSTASLEVMKYYTDSRPKFLSLLSCAFSFEFEQLSTKPKSGKPEERTVPTQWHLPGPQQSGYTLIVLSWFGLGVGSTWLDPNGCSASKLKMNTLAEFKNFLNGYSQMGKKLGLRNGRSSVS